MYASINGTKIFFDVEGLQYVPDGPIMRERPVCFVLHGGPGGEHANFLPELSALAQSMQLVYIDDRNCGRSRRGDITTSSIKQNAADIEALRQYLGLEKIYILGHSYGGMKAQQYALDHPDRLHGIILAGTSCNNQFLRGDRVLQHIKDWGTPEQYALYAGGDIFKGKMSYKQYMADMASLYHHKYFTEADRKAASDGLMRCIKNGEVTKYQVRHDMKDMNFQPELHRIKCPTLILVGEYDFITDVQSSQEIHAEIPQSELHVIADSSHELFSDRPDYVLPCIAEFVGRNFQPLQ